MNRTKRASMAEQTVAICEAGFYKLPIGNRISISEELNRAKAGTVLYSPEKLPSPTTARNNTATRFEVKNETTFEALSRLEGTGEHIGCLNFASAKNPGGGFLNGSLAQEEALACASGLYPCLLNTPEYYERNRANRSTLYLDLMIFSPLVPFFRDEGGSLLRKPVLASVITAPAPNAGAIARNEPENKRFIEPTLRRRAEMVLCIAAAHKVAHLVLGAWGCGVFQNDPRMVATVFAELLKPPGPYSAAFKTVIFGVFDRTPGLGTYNAFVERLR